MVSVVEAFSSLEWWYRRMGHPSERVVELRPQVSSNKISLNKSYEVYFRSKHSRDKLVLCEK